MLPFKYHIRDCLRSTGNFLSVLVVCLAMISSTCMLWNSVKAYTNKNSLSSIEDTMSLSESRVPVRMSCPSLTSRPWGYLLGMQGGCCQLVAAMSTIEIIPRQEWQIPCYKGQSPVLHNLFMLEFPLNFRLGEKCFWQ